MSCDLQHPFSHTSMSRNLTDSSRVKQPTKSTGNKRPVDYHAVAKRQPLPPLTHHPPKVNTNLESKKIIEYGKSSKPFFEATEEFCMSSEKYSNARARRDSFGSRGESAKLKKFPSSFNLTSNTPSKIILDRKRSESNDRFATKLGGDTNNNYRSKTLEKKLNVSFFVSFFVKFCLSLQ